MTERENSANRRKENIKLIAEIAVVIVSVVSLYFSWQANQTSKASVQPQVQVLGTYSATDRVWTTDEGKFGNFACRILIRVANIGGVNTDIVATAVNLETPSVSKNVQVSAVSQKMITGALEDKLWFFATVWKHKSDDIRDPAKIPNDTDGINYDLPMPLESHTTSDVYADIYFWYTPADMYEFHSVMINADEINTFSPSSYQPININVVLHFSDNSIITTTPIKCAYYK